jgi:hypothetical protein
MRSTSMEVSDVTGAICLVVESHRAGRHPGDEREYRQVRKNLLPH